MVYVKFKNQN